MSQLKINQAIERYLMNLDVLGVRRRFERLEEWFGAEENSEAVGLAQLYESRGGVKKWFMNVFIFITKELPWKPFEALVMQWLIQEERWVLRCLKSMNGEAEVYGKEKVKLIGSLMHGSPLKKLLDNVEKGDTGDEESLPVVVTVPLLRRERMATSSDVAGERREEIRKPRTEVSSVIEVRVNASLFSAALSKTLGSVKREERTMRKADAREIHHVKGNEQVVLRGASTQLEAGNAIEILSKVGAFGPPGGAIINQEIDESIQRTAAEIAREESEMRELREFVDKVTFTEAEVAENDDDEGLAWVAEAYQRSGLLATPHRGTFKQNSADNSEEEQQQTQHVSSNQKAYK